jgi:hypothetical protein
MNTGITAAYNYVLADHAVINLNGGCGGVLKPLKQGRDFTGFSNGQIFDVHGAILLFLPKFKPSPPFRPSFFAPYYIDSRSPVRAVPAERRFTSTASPLATRPALPGLFAGWCGVGESRIFLLKYFVNIYFTKNKNLLKYFHATSGVASASVNGVKKKPLVRGAGEGECLDSVIIGWTVLAISTLGSALFVYRLLECLFKSNDEIRNGVTEDHPSAGTGKEHSDKIQPFRGISGNRHLKTKGNIRRKRHAYTDDSK